MNQSIPQTRNMRGFVATLLSFAILMTPMAAVGASTRARTSPLPSAKQISALEKLENALFEPAIASPLVPSITASKTDSFPVHPSGKAQPGDEITYDFDILNSGTDATNVQFSDTIDLNTTLVAGSLKVSPVGHADNYATGEDTPLVVSAPGVLTNDTGTPSPNVTGVGGCVDVIAPFTGCATTGGGTVTVNADGSFNYSPLASFSGSDTFTYTISNGFTPDDSATVTITVDAAPTVQANTPLDNSLQQPNNTNLTITFSEPVNVTGNWFQIVCGTSGTRNPADTVVTPNGTNDVFTINPNTDFANGETCTVTIVAVQVADQDTNDPPDNLAADFVFDFTIDQAPSVTTTTPVNGATGVATNASITVTFDENVNAAAGAFTISCATSGSHTAVVSGGPVTFTVNPDTDFAAGEVCTVTIVAANVTDQDSGDPPDNPTANFIFSFTTDAAPSVTATTPTNGATGVASNTDITVTFSEDVNVAAGGFTISCVTSGAHTSVVSGGPLTFTINPDVDFVGGESCTVTVVAANVTDQDGNDPPDNMAANFVFSFTVDQAPSVTATTPTNGATKVANNTDVTVTFSENVDVTGTWFSIVCGTSGTHDTTNSTVTGGPATFTINPTDFANGESCTATIFAASVTDQDTGDPPNNMAVNFIFSFTIDNPPTVTTTVPTNGATGVAANTNITVNFSESVNATTSSFIIECPAGSGAIAYALSSSPASSFTLNPTADLPEGVICTVTVVAAQITDQDGGDPPDNMVADHVFTFAVPPRAVDDAHAATGNIRIDTATGAAFSVLANDVGPGISITAFDATSANGGTVTMNSVTGTFTYNPPAGYNGADTFTYTISNAAGSDVGLVTITISDMIWFIKNDATACTTVSAAAGCGRLTNPLSTLAAFDTANGTADTPLSFIFNPQAGDHIFIYKGASPGTPYTAPLTLENNQRVVGQGATSGLLSLTGITLAPHSDAAPATTGVVADRPTITSGGFGINLAQNNNLHGLTFNNTGNTAVSGSAGGAFVFSEIGVNNSGSAGGGISVTAASLLAGNTIEITGATPNTINARSGTGLRITNTNITINNVTFQSISAGNNDANPDPANGIVLNNTGSAGGLIVTGNSAGNCGGVVTPNAVGTPATITAPVVADCTGGTITNTTSDGVSLTNTVNTSLTRMLIRDSGDSGVFGTTLSGFSLISSWVESNGDTTVAEDSGLEFVVLTGTNNITNSTVSNSFEHSINWQPTSGTATLNITGTTVGPNPVGTGANGVHLNNSTGTVNSTLVITNCNIDGNQATGISPNAEGSSTYNIKVSNTTIKNNNIALNINSGTDADVNFNIVNNTIIDHANFAIGLVPVSTSTTNSKWNGIITGNRIGDGSVDSGSRDAYGIRGDFRGDVDAIVSITSNTITNTDIEPIFVEGRLDNAAVGTPLLDITIRSNTLGVPDDNSAFPFFAIYGMRLESRDNFTVTADVALNDATGLALEDIRFRQRNASTFKMERLTDGDGTPNELITNMATVEARIVTDNPGNSADATQETVATGYTEAANGATRDPSIPAAIAMNLNPFNSNSEMLASNSESKSIIFGAISGVGASVDFTSLTTGVAATSSMPNANATVHSNVTAQVETETILQPIASRARGSELAKTQSSASDVRKRGESNRPVSQPVSSHRVSASDKLMFVQNQKPDESKRSARQTFSHHAPRKMKAAPIANAATTTAAAPMLSGETVNVTIGTLRASRNVRIQFKVTVNNSIPAATTQVSNQGTVTADGPITVQTDDPAAGGANDPTVTPILAVAAAADDNYIAFKDTPLNVPAPGIVGNDGASPDVTAIVGCADVTAPFNCTTGQGGTLQVESNGSFTYTAALGYTGADSFSYTATNAAGSENADVNITVQDTTAIFINEVLFNPPGADAPNEYIELRGVGGATIPTGTYLVGIEGDAADNPGDVQTIINLGGLVFGPNGFLVLLQNGEGYTTDAGAQVETSTTTGFGGLPASRWSADSSATDIEDDSVTFMLIQTGVAPTLSDDIDVDNDAVPDGLIFAGWSVRDSIGILNATDNGRAYGAINYSNSENSFASGPVVFVVFVPTYVGRAGDTTGSAATDWVASGVLAGTAPNFTLGDTSNTEPSSFADEPLDHIGTTNFANQPPVNTVPGAQSTNEDTPLVFTGPTQISIADADAGLLAVQVTLTAVNGTITLGGTGGLSFTTGDGVADPQMVFTGSIADINAALNNLTFSPAPNFTGAASLTILTDDLGNSGIGGNQSDSDTINITVGAINDAPVLDNTGNMSLTSISENIPPASNTGTLVSAIIASAQPPDRITDADAGALEGIAVIAVDNTNGTWQFTIDNGTNWTPFGAPDSLNARLLAANATTLVRFVPNASFNGTVNAGITFRAWDQTSGTNGNTADASAVGGTTAFSTATETASITVNDGGTLQFSAATYSVSENGGPATITITRTGGSAGTATVLFQTSNGTADSGDYTTVSQTVTFVDGDTSETVNIPITNDTVNEPDETVNLTLSNAGGSGALGAPAAAVLTIQNDDTPAFNLSQSTYVVAEDGLYIDITVNRSGDTSAAASVDYETSDLFGLANCATTNGNASERCDYLTAVGTLDFAAGTTTQSFRIFVNDDVRLEGPELFTLTLSNEVGGVLGGTSTATVTITDHVVAPGAANPIDDPAFFIRMLYVDILSREPDTLGFQGWLDTINGCPNGGFGNDNPQCDRVHVAQSFYQSLEFGERGYFIYRFYDAGLGRRPTYREFIRGMQQIGGSLSPAQSEVAKQEFIDDLMATAEFQGIYGGMLTPPQANAFITELENRSGTQIPEPARSQLVSNMANGTKTAAETLRAFIESQAIFDAFFNRGFVSMLYFGYLRRAPDTLGFNDWLQVVNLTGDYRALTFGFIYSNEYRGRFGP